MMKLVIGTNSLKLRPPPQEKFLKIVVEKINVHISFQMYFSDIRDIYEVYSKNTASAGRPRIIEFNL